MSAVLDVAVVDAGQAGLATGHELAERGVDHVLLERGKIGQSRRGRWESFCLVTPNWSMQLPGRPYDGDDPDAFGVHVLRTRKPSLFLGVGDDARVVADAIAAG